MTALKPIGEKLQPVVRELFELVEAEGMMLKTLAWKSGYDPRWIRNLRRGHRNAEPSLTALSNMAEVLGYEVHLVKKETK